MAKYAEDDRIEQLSAQKRRMKQLEHRRAVERLIEERKAQFQKQKVLIVFKITMEYSFIQNFRRSNCLINKKKKEWKLFVDLLLNKRDRSYSKNMLLSFWDIFQRCVTATVCMQTEFERMFMDI